MAEPPPDEGNEADDIKVTDRRQFTSDGDRVAPGDDSRPDPEKEPGPELSAERSEGRNPELVEGPAETPSDAGTDPPPGVPDFSTLVMSLATAALLHLGDIADPAHPQGPVDLPRAREAIDILGMLQEKTSGNLTPEEQNLLDTWLCTLRTAFSKKATAS